MSIFILSREKILRHQKIEEMRNPSLYKDIRSIADIGNECAWIHSMVCLYLINMVHNDNIENIENNENNENIENTISFLSSHLLEFERAMEWHYRDGIDKCIRSIKELMGNDFIEFEENEEDEEDDEDDEKENEEKDRKDRKDEKDIIDITNIIDIKNIIRSKL